MSTTDDDRSALGARIREARLARNKLLKDVAQPFGISIQSVSNWEGAHTRPDADKLAQLARLLGVSLDWLMDGRGVRDLVDGDTPIALAVRRKAVMESAGRATLVDEDGYESASRAVGPGSWRVSAWDDSNAPAIAQGSRLIVDPNPVPRLGDMVMVTLTSTGEPQIRRYEPGVRDGERVVTLRPLNPEWVAETYIGEPRAVEDFELHGVIVEVTRFRPLGF